MERQGRPPGAIESVRFLPHLRSRAASPVRARARLPRPLPPAADRRQCIGAVRSGAGGARLDPGRCHERRDDHVVRRHAAHGARLAGQADDGLCRLHGDRGKQDPARRHRAGERGGDGGSGTVRLADVHRAGSPGHGRRTAAGPDRRLGKRCRGRAGRAHGRQPGGFRRAHERGGAPARHEEHALRQRHRPARSAAVLNGGRPRPARAAAARRLPAVRAALRGSGSSPTTASPSRTATGCSRATAASTA